ncbi:hypothetical protein [Streptomyces sp. ADI95-17]|uniref:hypothetical protein n=1 Tax=Streptomyces sp. ADI95-17 TaxID=1522759 RepID=UPI000F5BAD99|nr:hypothetical protein [Streptomyces sp. ADI95-17]RPK53953.1 hypothetical protein EES42_43780 [Streptomyces sp. ADI95-17]
MTSQSSLLVQQQRPAIPAQHPVKAPESARPTAPKGGHQTENHPGHGSENSHNHLKCPDTFVWPLNFPTGDIRPPRARDARTGTDFDPDPDGGEDAPTPEARPALRLAG